MGEALSNDATAAGFLLAEALHEEAPGRTREATHPALARRLETCAEGVDGDRLAELVGAAGALLPPPAIDVAERDLPPRARALVAPAAPREAARRWVAAVPPHRPGYRPPADLLAHLRHLASASRTPTAGPPWPG